MIRSMVQRLADRLQIDGSDVAGWLRLVRAYVVLGDRDKAKNAPPKLDARCRTVPRTSSRSTLSSKDWTGRMMRGSCGDRFDANHVADANFHADHGVRHKL